MKKFGVLLILVIVAIFLTGTAQADDPNNLLKNPSFEIAGPPTGIYPPEETYNVYPHYSANPGELTGVEWWWRWGGGGSVAVRDVNYIQNDPNARTGDDFMQITFPGGWVGFTQCVIDVCDVNIIADITYTQSIYAKDPNYDPLNPAKFSFKLEFYDDPNKFYPQQIAETSSGVYTLTDEWKNYDYTFISPNVADLCKFHVTYYCVVGVTPAGKVLWFDDAALKSGGAASPCDRANLDARVNYGYWGPLPGDFDQDCYITMNDLETFTEGWLDCTLEPNSLCP